MARMTRQEADLIWARVEAREQFVRALGRRAQRSVRAYLAPR